MRSRRRGVFVVIAAAAGAFVASCLIEAELTPCGDLVCAPSQRCIAPGQCATADAIDACAPLDEGDPCQSATATGTCRNGACVANVCGDGAVTGNEVCDGDDVPITCSELGYYTGSPSCAPGCVVDRAGCRGRCGDGIVQADYQEACDGLAPAETCGDFGRDWGTLGCNVFCTPDIASDCFTYGWETVLAPRPGFLETTAAANLHGAVALNDSLVRLSWDRVVSERANTGAWDRAFADGSTFVLTGATSTTWFDGTEWRELAGPLAGSAGTAWLAGSIYELDADCTFRATELASGAQTSLPAAPDTTCMQLVQSSGELVTLTSSAVVAWNGTQWHTVAMNQAANSKLFAANGGHVWIFLGGVNVVRVELATGIPRRADLSTPQNIIPSGDLEVMSIGTGGGGTSFNLMVSGSLLSVGLLPFGVFPKTTSAEGAIIAFGSGFFGSGGVYRLAPIPAVTTLNVAIAAMYALPMLDGSGAGSSGNLGVGSAAYLLSSGDVAACGAYSVGWLSGTTAGDYVTTHAAYYCQDMIGDPRDRYIFADSSGVWASDTGTYEYNGVGGTLTGTVDDAWTSSYESIAHRNSDGTWTEIALPAGCTFEQLAGGGPSPVYVAVTCGTAHALYRHDAAAWVHITDLPVAASALEVAPDGELFVSSDVTARLVGTTLIPVGPPTPRIVALGAGEVYLDRQDGVFVHVANGVRSSLRMQSGPLVVTPWAYYTSAGNLYIMPRMPTSMAGRGP